MSEQVREAVRRAIVTAINDASVRVEGEAGHYAIEVVSPTFEGKSRLQRDRAVLQAIASLMSGDAAPVHAVDTLVTRAS
jgi:stress-induced morphogen